MRLTDIQRLASATREAPFDDPQALRALGTPLPNLERLENAVLDDMSVGPPYGISWWKNCMPTCHRIAISDQLYSCTQSISQNLIEAQLHWFEFLGWSDRADLLASVEWDSGEPILCYPRNDNALVYLTPKIKSMHEVGVMRSLCSSLDCLAGTIIVIMALDMRVLTSGFMQVRRKLNDLREPTSKKSSFRETLQSSFARDFDRFIVCDKPPGWVEWMLNYRNMVVHRGRRFSAGQFVPSIGGESPSVSIPCRWIDHLPIDPNRSDIEVLSGLDSLGQSLLAEDSKATIRGLLESTVDLVEATSDLLLHVWTLRRRNPTQLVQPQSQWGRTAPRVGFVGYNPKEYKLPSKGSPALANPILRKRFRAASLFDESRNQWEEFKADPRCKISD